MKKTILLIGSSSNITEYLTDYFIKEEDNIIITYNTNIDSAKELKNKYSSIQIEHLDVTNEEEVSNIFKKHNNIDIVINNSCAYQDNTIEDKTKKEFMKVIETNILGTFLVDKYAIMNLNNSLIINMSSTDGIDTYNKLNVDYSASKAAIINLTKSLSLSSKDNRVISIVPNWINTKSTQNIDKEYLNNELHRIGQDRLITMKELTDSMSSIIKNNPKNGSIYRIDIKDGALWIKNI